MEQNGLIFCFVQAGSEVSALLGRMSSVVGYEPTLMGSPILKDREEEQAAESNTKKRSVESTTSISNE
ncbi:hypothetical protein RND71_007160 [Anisodus tanguticus]|uniref:Uncharacterized protein n=1 Tax=Anisodus tanguticus TaxID=243964 RepID=A0AAE1SLD8_9SOLA|nr:hypothetical protein RND71_007160 [Anisodus tanguticus]